MLIFQLIRLRQWSKNLIIYVVMFASNEISQENIVTLIILFFGFSLIVSSSYIFNDIVDKDSDINHPTKKMRPDLIQETIYSKGYLSEYDIWEFLRTKPSEVEVLETFGLPDSVWLDDLESTKFIYYFVDMIQDYNTIEISTKTDSVSGFEWD